MVLTMQYEMKLMCSMRKKLAVDWDETQTDASSTQEGSKFKRELRVVGSPAASSVEQTSTGLPMKANPSEL